MTTPQRGTAPGAIVTRALTRRFDKVVAVDRLDLDVPAGAIHGLLGPNGAGKSTTIKMLTTLLPPSGGSAQVAGFDIARQTRDVRRRIGYVPQLLSADAALTARENLLLSARLYGIPRAGRRQRIDDALAFMGLAEVGNDLVRTYSGGMIRRLELAQAMLHEPAVLFLDEPTIGLDPVARRNVWERLQELRRAHGTTILVTTHDMEEAEELCDELWLMHQGRIAVHGRPDDLKAALGPEATLSDVFAHHSGAELQAGGGYRSVRQTRQTAQRLG